MGNIKMKGPRTVDWTDPDNVVLLLTKDENWLAVYFGKTYNEIKATKKRIITKIKNGKLKMEKEPGKPLYSEEQLGELAKFLEDKGIPLDQIGKINSIRRGTYETVTKDADGEAVTHTLNVTNVSYTPREDLTALDQDFISQAAPTIVRPSRRKLPQRDFRRTVAFSDPQIAHRQVGEEFVEIHDERAMRVARLMCHDLQPEVIVNCGDTVDLPQLGKYDPDSNHFLRTLQKSFDRAHSFYAELRADNPQAEIHEVDSNHNVRLGKFVLRHAMALYGLKQAGTPPESWPILTYPFLANLDAVDVQWHGGYGAARFHLPTFAGEGPGIDFIHGDKVRSNGSTADLLSKNYPYSNVVAGHGHKAQTHARTTPDGLYLTAVQMGALCKTTGEVPGYGTAVDDRGNPVHKQQDWQQSILVIEDYGNGHYNFDHVYIVDGKAYYRGKEYDGNT